MRLSITKQSLKISPDETYPNPDERDMVFIEQVLGLKKEGDSVRLVRVEDGDTFYLETIN